MQVICQNCRSPCTVDDQAQVSISCPNCGCVILTKSSFGPRQTPGETPKGDDETGTQTVASPADQLIAASLPTGWGRYRIDLELGSGGYAHVYRGEDLVLGRTVALKIPRPSAFRSSERLHRFLAEARTAGQLRHHGIVTVYDVGEFAPESYYIAMEYVDGQSLQQRIATERMSYEDATELVAKVAEAVHFAHGRGVVHRDLKPSNILFDQQGEPRVVDFGLAIHEEGQAALAGEVAGTPAYMAPEQFRGEAHHLDGRCDVWSLGIIRHGPATGRRRWKGDRGAR